MSLAIPALSSDTDSIKGGYWIFCDKKEGHIVCSGNLYLLP